jgi:hypothetical protein
MVSQRNGELESPLADLDDLSPPATQAYQEARHPRDDVSQPARQVQESKSMVARVYVRRRADADDVPAEGGMWREGSKPRTISSAPMTPDR